MTMFVQDDQLDYADDDPLFTELVHTTLERELGHRLGLEAHVQLGIRAGSDAETVEQAWREQRARYQPESFERYGGATVAVALQLVALLVTPLWWSANVRVQRELGVLAAEQTRREAVYEVPPIAWRPDLRG